MRKLTLIRHAKSSWKYANLTDEDRPLNKRGRRDAPMMGQRLAERGVGIERLVSSPALRALRTAAAIGAAVGVPPDQLRIDPLLYSADTEQILEGIRSLNDSLQSVALVGHNPEMALLMERLACEPIGHVPTCAVAMFHFKTERWSQVGQQRIRISHFEFDYPKNINP